MAEQYKIMGCAIYMVPAYNANASPFDYQEPDQPALTKHGWIKMQVIGIQLEESEVRMALVSNIPCISLIIFNGLTWRLYRRNINPSKPTLPNLT